MSGGLLRLRAEDGADLEVISAAVQDSVFRLGDAQFDRRQRRFTLAINRYRWEQRRPERVGAVLAFEDVAAAASKAVRQGADAAVANILALKFEPAASPPGGTVEIALSGGGAIRLEVEALDVVLADLGAPRPARRPDHGGAGT